MKAYRLQILFCLLAFLAMGQVVWWAYLLIELNHNYQTMILSEGSFFIVVWALAVASAYLMIRRSARLHQAQSDFLSTVTHELKTPITNISLAAETLSRADLPVHMKQKYLDRIQSACDLLNREVEAVLVLTQNGLGKSEKTLVQLSDLVDRIFVHVSERGYDQHRIQSVIHPEIQTDSVYLFFEELRLVLQNLLENALIHSGSDRIDFSVTLSNNSYVFSIRDSGRGLSSNELRQIFLPFWRSDSSRIEARPGSGLGLALAQRLCNVCGYGLKITSAGLNQGVVAEVKVTAERSL